MFSIRRPHEHLRPFYPKILSAVHLKFRCNCASCVSGLEPGRGGAWCVAHQGGRHQKQTVHKLEDPGRHAGDKN